MVSSIFTALQGGDSAVLVTIELSLMQRTMKGDAQSTARQSMQTLYRGSVLAMLLGLLSIQAVRAQDGLNGPNYVFGDEVSTSQRDALRTGINSGVQYVYAKTGFGVDGFSVYAYADLDRLVNTYAQVFQIPVDAARSHWQASTAISGPGVIFFFVPRMFADPSRLTKTCAHEYFHLVQNKLTNGNLIGAADNEVPRGGPRWLIEGAAEYVGGLAADAAGALGYVSYRNSNRAGAVNVTLPLSDMEVLAGISVGGGAGYNLAFLACDFLAPETGPRFPSVQSLVRFWELVGRGSSWPQAFQVAFNRSVADFYVQFEQYRLASFRPALTPPFGLSLDAIYPSVAAIGSDYPQEAFPYVFRLTGFDLVALTGEQVFNALKRPSGIESSGTSLGVDLIVLYLRPNVPSGTYTVAFDPPDGRHAETTFTYQAPGGANPVPSISSLSPDVRVAGDAGFKLSVRGGNFVLGAKVQWNGADKVTTMRPDSTLEIALDGPDIAIPGVVPVKVINPAPGGGASNTVNVVVGKFEFPISPLFQSVSPGSNAALTSTVTGGSGMTVQWQMNGRNVSGATSATLTVANVQPANAGLYTATVDAGATTSAAAILGVSTTSKVIGAGEELFPHDIPHPNGNIFDQVLLTGAAATVTSDAGQVTRISFIDLTNDIVQVEFSGSGTLSLVLDDVNGPALPANYNQNVTYMKGHASIVITGANETTNVGVFSVGRITAVNPALFKSEVVYDGMADIAYLAIQSTNGKFGGLRTANTRYFATKGLTGIYAPGVQFSGPVYVSDISASDAAKPVFIIGSSPDTRITGGNLVQANGKPVEVSGLTRLTFTAGSSSHAVGDLPAQTNHAQLQQNGVNVTAQTVVNPSP